ncbi:MAG: hypothetical protein K2M19_04475 [Muribaculaceae bacterium]|nr:hypothetical protein [Muribaculaceae bacterium]
MNIPLITWSAVVTLLAVTAIVHLYHTLRFGLRHNHKLIEIGRDSDEFFVPGDDMYSDDSM